MPTRIEQCWSRLRSRKEKALIAFLMAGDPTLAATVKTVIALAAAGVDIVEIGIPFSEPIADGPVIQRSGERALRQGAYMPAVLDMVREIRRESEIPVLFFSYLNPVLRYGLDCFADDAVSSGADGALITDLSVEEASPYVATMRKKGLDTVFLAAPTSTDERLKRVCELSTGFVYAITRAGVTGAQERVSTSLEPLVKRLRTATSLPIAAGFGISRPEHLREVAPLVDGVVVGSALVNCIEQHPDDPALHAAEFARWLRQGFETPDRETAGQAGTR